MKFILAFVAIAVFWGRVVVGQVGALQGGNIGQLGAQGQKVGGQQDNVVKHQWIGGSLSNNVNRQGEYVNNEEYRKEGLRVLPSYNNAGYYGNGKSRPRQQSQGQRVVQQQEVGQESLESLEEEEEKPDRLTELMLNSKFGCQGKKDGYYADDSLNCEVFHYCQDGGKHSWLCPNQFAFHQIHLICVPPSSDNICKESSNFHFVNDYLYKPVNQKEADNYNATLKYADRFFPEGYNNGGAELIPNNDNRYYEEEYRPRQHAQQGHSQSHSAAHAQGQQHGQGQHAQGQGQHAQGQGQHAQGRPQSQQVHRPHAQNSNQRPHAHVQNSNQRRPPQHAQQVYHQQREGSEIVTRQAAFYSPESVNIPLTQRRPLPTNFRPSQLINKKQYYY